MNKPKVKVNGKSYECLSQPNQESAEVKDCACPHCKANPLRVSGSGMRIGANDRSYEADGFCASCGKHVGLITVATNTLFGLKEDEAVLKHGRARIY